MGLAERKQKQKIGADPRNLTWSEDTSRFGQQYLAKYGWDRQSGLGLGANGDGRTKHISVVQRLNAMGIGGKPSGPDAVAWKQNKDFENVLKRLNMSEDDDTTEAKKKDDSVARAYLQGFVRAEKIGATFDTVEEEVVTPGEDDPAIIKAKRKEERKKRKADAQDDIEEKQTPKVPPHMAHRAKFRRSKQLASVSSTALSEILGVSSSTPGTGLSTAEASPSPSSTPNFNSMTSTSMNGHRASVINDQLTTSSTSVADYFAAKMKARREQMLQATSLQNTVEGNGDAGIADTPNETPVEMEAGVAKSIKKRKKEKKIKVVSEEYQDDDDAKEASVVPQEDIEAEQRERKRRKKEEKAHGPKKKKKRLASEV